MTPDCVRTWRPTELSVRAERASLTLVADSDEKQRAGRTCSFSAADGYNERSSARLILSFFSRESEGPGH